MMTPEQREQYERAAVLVLEGEVVFDLPLQPHEALVIKAWSIVRNRPNYTNSFDIEGLGQQAARLLRECIAENEVLK